MNNNSAKSTDLEYNDSYANQVNEIINTLELDSETDRSILKSRFLSEVVKYEQRKLHTKKYYDRFRFIVTVGRQLREETITDYVGEVTVAKAY